MAVRRRRATSGRSDPVWQPGMRAGYDLGGAAETGVVFAVSPSANGISPSVLTGVPAADPARTGAPRRPVAPKPEAWFGWFTTATWVEFLTARAPGPASARRPPSPRRFSAGTWGTSGPP